MSPSALSSKARIHTVMSTSLNAYLSLCSFLLKLSPLSSAFTRVFSKRSKVYFAHSNSFFSLNMESPIPKYMLSLKANHVLFTNQHSGISRYLKFFYFFVLFPAILCNWLLLILLCRIFFQALFWRFPQ